jgi:hypothetical protein
MAILRKFLFVSSLATLALLGLSGCASDQKDSSIPWARPQSWENQIPGMTR